MFQGSNSATRWTALEMSKYIASAGVVMDAKEEKAQGFYRKFGFIAFPESVKRLFLPMQTVEQLFSRQLPPASPRSSQ